MCSSGKPVPVRRADWVKYVEGLRQAGMAAYKAAQAKNQDAMVDVSGTVADACAACHEVYREKKSGLKDRCLP
jgi:cytochrome c556